MGVSAEVKVVFAGAGELVAIAKCKVSHVCSMYVCIYIYIIDIYIYISILFVCSSPGVKCPQSPQILTNPYRATKGR